jgi:centrosomal protein CEP41
VPKKQFLVLDVREREEFDACHIHGSKWYHHTMLNRSTNNFTPEMLLFKNRPNHFVVIYDLEEELVSGKMKVGNNFFQKGFDNVLIISGGLKEFVQTHSHLAVGVPPCKIVPRKPPPAPRLSSGAVVRAGSGQGPRGLGSGASTMATSVASSHKPKSLASSLARRNPSAGSAWH